MIRSHRSFLLLAVVLGAAWLAIPPPSQAAFSLTLEASGSPGITVTDGGVGDINPATGVITFSGAVGNFTFNVTTGFSKPIAGGPDEAHIDLNSVSVSSSAGGALTITLIDTDFNLPAQSGPLVLQSLVGGTVTAPAGSTLTFQSWANGVTPGELGPFGLGAFSDSATTTFGPTGPFSSEIRAVIPPFSLESRAVITLTGPGFVSFNGNTIVGVPAPGGITLVLCAGVPFLGFCGLRRLRKKA